MRFFQRKFSKVRFASAFNKIFPLGVLISALGCAICFPFLGALASAIGIGFLAQYESAFINYLLPLFSFLALVFMSYAWWIHKNHFKGIVGVIGPTIVLASLYLFWEKEWSVYLFYLGLGMMVVVSIWDIVKTQKSCEKDV